jgi:hypothetical protein
MDQRSAVTKFPGAFAVLVSVPVFKTGEASLAGLVGSIPIRFRLLNLGRFAIATISSSWKSCCGIPALPVSCQLRRPGRAARHQRFAAAAFDHCRETLGTDRNLTRFVHPEQANFPTSALFTIQPG